MMDGPKYKIKRLLSNMKRNYLILRTKLFNKYSNARRSHVKIKSKAIHEH